MDRMQELINLINEHNYNYYVLDNPTISDDEWDKLYYELVGLEKSTGVIYDNSPTQRVGDIILEGFKKVSHKHKLYSLDKVNSIEELDEWISDIKKDYKNADFSLEYKFDGLRLILEYNNGNLIRASTRGNGLVGEDVTVQVKTIKSVPLSIKFKDALTVAGEGMMTLSSFEKYNKKAEEKLKNPRNAAAGAIRNLDPKITASRNLDVFVYDIISIDGRTFNTQNEVNDFLIDNKFLTGEMFFVSNDINEIAGKIRQTDEIKNNINIMIDGMVIKLNQINLRQELGYTSKFPKWAVAFKFEAQETTSRLNDVIWQVGRTGKITPIAIIEPTELAGATVTRATLNNYEEILKKKIKIFSNVFVRRSNEVIPEILGLASDTQDSKEVPKPTACPCCQNELVQVGPNLFCKNSMGCREQIVNKIAYFCSRNCMNIEGLSDKTIEALYDNCGVRSIADIYKINTDDLAGLEGFKDKKINNVLNAITKSKTPNLNSFIDALSINNVGAKTSKDLAKRFASLAAIAKATSEELQNIRDIGLITAQSIVDFFADKDNLQLIRDLNEQGVIINNQQSKILGNSFEGKKVVLTGTLENYTRDKAAELIEQHGGEVVNSVSKNTDLVVVGKDAGSKFAKAVTLKIKTIDEAEFINLLKS